MDNVNEIFIRDSRFYVRFNTEDGRQKTMPRANYIWLRNNPAFKEIPKGYVIHHLDEDSTNDDPSNLALMQKYHHSAHHWKHKTITPQISFDIAHCVEYAPTCMPTVQKCAGVFYVAFCQKDENGKRKLKKVWRKNGKKFYTKEEAQLHAKEIWDSYNRYQDAV